MRRIPILVPESLLVKNAKNNPLPKEQALFDGDSKRIPEIIGPRIERALLVAIKPREYMQEAPPGWVELFGTSVHSTAVQVALLDLGWWRLAHIPPPRFACFMERGDPDYGKVMTTPEGMRDHIRVWKPLIFLRGIGITIVRSIYLRENQKRRLEILWR